MLLPHELDLAGFNDLIGFWGETQLNPNKAARDLGTDYGTVLMLAKFAGLKACAVKARLEGKIGKAMVFESHCEQVYHNLPASVRW